MMQLSNLNLLESAIERSLAELSDDFKITPQGAGWHQYFRGWAYVSNITNHPNTECTCRALLALHTVSKESNATTISSGIDWLKHNFISSGANKGWASFEGNGFRTYATCMALKTLFTLGESNSIEFSQALTTLKKINGLMADGLKQLKAR